MHVSLTNCCLLLNKKWYFLHFDKVFPVKVFYVWVIIQSEVSSIDMTQDSILRKKQKNIALFIIFIGLRKSSFLLQITPSYLKWNGHETLLTSSHMMYKCELVFL